VRRLARVRCPRRMRSLGRMHCGCRADVRCCARVRRPGRMWSLRRVRRERRADVRCRARVRCPRRMWSLGWMHCGRRRNVRRRARVRRRRRCPFWVSRGVFAFWRDFGVDDAVLVDSCRKGGLRVSDKPNENDQQKNQLSDLADADSGSHSRQSCYAASAKRKFKIIRVRHQHSD
jgi:hypothetical protein